MLSPGYLCTRRCVRDLMHVLTQVEWRAAARAPIVLDESSTGLLLLWTVLRGERTFLLRCLEQLGADMWALTCDLDDLVNQRKLAGSQAGEGIPISDPSSWSLPHALHPLLLAWLARTQQQASALQHRYLGTEHLLLAILAAPDAGLTSLLSRHGVDYEKLKGAVLEALSRSPPVAAELVAEGAGEPRGAGWDAPAVGVPRRFSLAMLMMMITLYAV